MLVPLTFEYAEIRPLLDEAEPNVTPPVIWRKIWDYLQSRSVRRAKINPSHPSIKEAANEEGGEIVRMR